MNYVVLPHYSAFAKPPVSDGHPQGSGTVRVQTLRAEATINTFDKRIICGLTFPANHISYSFGDII